MKKTVLCIFSLVAWLLVFCTLVSQKIEVEMLTQVSAREVRGSRMWGKSIELGKNVLFGDENDYHLYELEEGTGWESGIRVREVPSDDYSYEEALEMVLMPGGGKDHTFIVSASRQPREGELVEIFKKPESGSDTYLLVYPFGVPEYGKPPYRTAVAAQSENALLLSMESVELPFMEHKAKGQLSTMEGEIILDDITDLEAISAGDGEAWRVFSLQAVEEFLGNLPMLATLLTVLLVSVLLWLATCFLPRENRGCLWVNVVIVLALLCGLPYVLKSIDLPASLLPTENILTWSHYSREFSMVFDALKSLGASGQPTLDLAARMQGQALRTLTVGLLLTFALIAAEVTVILVKRRHSASDK